VPWLREGDSFLLGFGNEHLSVREAIVKYEDQRKELDVLIKAAQAKLNDLIVDK